MKKGIFYGWIIVVACFLLMAVGEGVRYCFGIFVTPLEQDFCLTRAAISGIFSAYMIISSVAAIPAGWLVDRYGPRIIGVIMGFFAGLGLFLSGQAQEFWHLYITYGLLFSLGTGVNFYIAVPVTSKWFMQKRGLALGIVTTGTGIGIIALPLATSYFTSSYDWRTACLILAPIALLITSGSSLFLKKDPSEVNALPDGKIAGLSQLPLASVTTEPKFNLTEVLKTRNYWLIFFIWVIISSCLHMVMTQVVAGAISLGIPAMRAAKILTLIGISSIPGRLLMGMASDRFDKRKVIIMCTLSMAGGMLLVMGSSSLLIFYLFALIFGFGYGGTAPVCAALIPEAFGLSHVGVIMGTLGIAWGVGAAMGSVLGGYIFDISGSYCIAYLVGAVIMIIATVFALYLEQPHISAGPPVS